MTGPLHPTTLADLRELIGNVPPASDGVVADIATTFAERRALGLEDVGFLISRLIVEGERIEDRRARLVALDNDAQNIRGLLAPANGPRVVPMELGDTLLPAVEWLVEQLATTPRLAYRAEIHNMTLGTYTTRAEAEQHCEADLRANIVLEHKTLSWIPEDDSAAAVSELAMIDRAGDDEATGYVTTPIELQTTFDPNAEG